MALTLIGLVTVLPAQADLDAAQWSSAELLWNEEYDAYVVVPTLGDDIFQERLVWSDHYTDFVPVVMAHMAEMRNYHEQVVWSEYHGDFVPLAMIESCPKLRGKPS
ncbi:MAG: hypothetical protein Q8Q28_04460 [Pseudomonadota bacterium]|nr:hypothetical protein [Pseudomonadota bacterium]